MNIIQSVQEFIFGQETNTEDNYDRFQEKLAFVRDVVAVIDETMLDMNAGEHQDGWLDDFFINLYKLSPRGYTPIFMIYVDGIYFETMNNAVEYMLNNLQF